MLNEDCRQLVVIRQFDQDLFRRRGRTLGRLFDDRKLELLE